MSTKQAKTGPRKQVVLVEIGSEWLKIVQVEASGKKLAISKLHLEKFDAVGADLTRAISGAFRKHKFADIPVIACLPRQSVNIRMLDLPSTEPSEIADMVDLQVTKQTPYSKDEVLCDHRILGSNRSGYTQVMLVIVQRSVLRQRYAAIEAAGLQIEKMSVTSEGLLSWCAASNVGLDSTVVLLDVGAASSELAVISGGRLAFTRGMRVGAADLLTDFAGNKDRFMREVNRSMDMCRTELAGLAPERAVITGAVVPELEACLGDALGLGVSSIDSLSFMQGAPPEPDLKSGEYRAVSLAALTGIAVAPAAVQFNLVPDVVKMRKDLALRSRRLSGFVVLIMAALVASSFFAVVKVLLVKHRHDILRSKFEESLPTVSRVERMRELIKIVHERDNARDALFTIIDALHDVVGDEVNIDSADLDGLTGRITLIGSAGTPRDIRNLITKLEQSDHFESVKEAGTMTRDARTSRYKFEVVCIVEKPA